MESNPLENWDALSESAKAFAEMIMGSDQMDLIHDSVLSYSQLQSENKQLKSEVASLKGTLPFKEKYENLQREFRKIAAERDSLSSQALKFNHMSADYDRMKSAYQETKGQLAALRESMEGQRSSISEWSALEALYQGFKAYCARCGYDIRRIPVDVFLQFQLQDSKRSTMNLKFNRKARDKWTKLNN